MTHCGAAEGEGAARIARVWHDRSRDANQVESDCLQDVLGLEEVFGLAL